MVAVPPPAAVDNIVSPPSMWLRRPRTSNSAQGVGFDKSAVATPATFSPANVVARSIRSIGSTTAPLIGEHQHHGSHQHDPATGRVALTERSPPTEKDARVWRRP